MGQIQEEQGYESSKTWENVTRAIKILQRENSQWENEERFQKGMRTKGFCKQ